MQVLPLVQIIIFYVKNAYGEIIGQQPLGFLQVVCVIGKMVNCFAEESYLLNILRAGHVECRIAIMNADRWHQLDASCHHDLPGGKIKCVHKYCHVYAV